MGTTVTDMTYGTENDIFPAEKEKGENRDISRFTELLHKPKRRLSPDRDISAGTKDLSIPGRCVNIDRSG